MNWPGIAAIGVGLVIHAIVVAFYFGQLKQLVNSLQDWKRHAEDKLEAIALLKQRMDQFEEWRDGKGGVRERLHDLWNFKSAQEAREYLERHKSGGDD